MHLQLYSIALIALLGAMIPGPDFALVTKNTILHSRTSGYFTSFGVGAAILVHMTYCLLGLALIISKSLLLFSLIKYLGASYLIYLGLNSFFYKQTNDPLIPPNKQKPTELSKSQSFRQGFLCNLLNPESTLFFLSLFTVVIKPDTRFSFELIYYFEIFTIATAWYCVLVFVFSHRLIKRPLDYLRNYLAKLLGISLLGFGVALAFVKH